MAELPLPYPPEPPVTPGEVSDPPADGERQPAPGRDELDAGLRGLHEQAAAAQLGQVALQAQVRALVQTLVAEGVLPEVAYERRRRRHFDAGVQALAEAPAVKLGTVADKYALGPLPDVDCATLMPLCKGRCCTLDVYCSPQDLDERAVQWDYARPYRLRHRSDGYCVHSEPGSRRCGVYAQRPATCRTYDCRRDARIWRDFEQRIPADES